MICWICEGVVDGEKRGFLGHGCLHEIRMYVRLADEERRACLR